MEARRISAVLCSGDLERSRTFYEQVVELTLSPETIPNHLLFECGDGTTLLVYGRPAPNKADHTQVRFWTDDVESDVRELESRGAVFEDYDFPTLTTVGSRRHDPRHRQVGLVQGPRRKHARPLPARVATSGRRTPSDSLACALRVRECLPALCSIGLDLRAIPTKPSATSSARSQASATSSTGDSPLACAGVANVT